MCTNTCSIISVTPLTSSLADLSVRNTFHLLRRSASWHAVYICSHLLLLYRTIWSVDKEVVLLPIAVYRSYSRAAVLPHFGVTIQPGTGPFRSKYPWLGQWALGTDSPDRPAINSLWNIGTAKHYAGVWSVPGDLYNLNSSLAISTWEALCSAVCISHLLRHPRYIL